MCLEWLKIKLHKYSFKWKKKHDENHQWILISFTKNSQIKLHKFHKIIQYTYFLTASCHLKTCASSNVASGKNKTVLPFADKTVLSSPAATIEDC